MAKFLCQSNKLLFFFYIIFIKNFTEFVKGILCITVQACKVLFLVFFIADFNFALRYCCFGCAISFIRYRHPRIRS